MNELYDDMTMSHSLLFLLLPFILCILSIFSLQ